MTEPMFDLGQHDETRPRRKRWGGARSTTARTEIRRQLKSGPVPCWRCGRVWTSDDPESGWQAGHTTDRAVTEATGLPEADTALECKGCNLSEGGRAGAAITNRKHSSGRASQHIEPARDKEPQWW